MAIFFAKVTCDKIPEFIGNFFIEQIDAKTTKDSQQAVTTLTITNKTNVTSNNTTCDING